MRTIITKTFGNPPPPYSKKNHFQWMSLKKIDSNKPNKTPKNSNSEHETEEEEEEVEILAFSSSSSFNENLQNPTRTPFPSCKSSKKKSPSALAGDAIVKFRSTILTVINNRIRNKQGGHGPCVIGTIYGRRRGRVHISFQMDPKLAPTLLIELETATSTLVKEMSSGLVRIALECHRSVPGQDKRKSSSRTTTSATRKLLEEPIWRAYCNGKKCGYATRKESGPLDRRLFKAVEPVSVGAGVLPPEKDENGENGGDGELGDVMYMRARFERVVGSKDSEAFYMLNPDGNGGPELSIYLLRV